MAVQVNGETLRATRHRRRDGELVYRIVKVTAFGVRPVGRRTFPTRYAADKVILGMAKVAQVEADAAKVRVKGKRAKSAKAESVRTNIELDAALVREAQELGGIGTKRAVIHQALIEFVAHRKRLDLRELEGADLIDPNYDHKALRTPAGGGD